ncbi:flavin reductase family protein [Thermomicrobium sp. 4228-Ro]|uniref:flavin reductase family protein n=1 Tax=Thermomicrobium sp. 4228-Ro TaxID=2993937 RepID=UPI0022490DA0|nr:flavin reductase family protein [Thermomicrobium sp. 4228-Ro]MCX2727304.1 flavin reductase family protein [Thermomicrobium sp. 4228-Ro]
MGRKEAREPRMAARLLEPGPVVLVTTQHRSQPNVMTAAWVMPLSLDPPRIGLAIHPSRFTHELLGKGEFFALNILTIEYLPAIHLCGTLSGRDLDKFARAELHAVDALEIDVPVIEEAVAQIECGLVGRLSLGDHDLFIGDVLAVAADAELFGERWLQLEDAPLAHHVGAEWYAALARVYRARLPGTEEEEAELQEESER